MINVHENQLFLQILSDIISESVKKRLKVRQIPQQSWPVNQENGEL